MGWGNAGFAPPQVKLAGLPGRGWLGGSRFVPSPGEFLQQARDFYQIKTYYAARPIDNPTPPSPPISYAVPQPYNVPQPCYVPQPCWNSGDPWAGDQAMEEFSEE